MNYDKELDAMDQEMLIDGDQLTPAECKEFIRDMNAAMEKHVRPRGWQAAYGAMSQEVHATWLITEDMPEHYLMGTLGHLVDAWRRSGKRPTYDELWDENYRLKEGMAKALEAIE